MKFFLSGINGYMHMIDNVLIYEPDLRAYGCRAQPNGLILLITLLFLLLKPGIGWPVNIFHFALIQR